MEGVAAAAAGTALEGWSGAPGVAAAAAMAAALLAGVLGVADAAADAGEAGVSTDAAFRVLPVPEQSRLPNHCQSGLIFISDSNYTCRTYQSS
jgi:hypothetical protein